MQNLVILGGGFAGLWAAMAAAGETAKDSTQDIVITLIAREADLVIRPRLYEGAGEDKRVPLAPLLTRIGVQFVLGEVEDLAPRDRHISYRDLSKESNQVAQMAYDSVVLATGSRMKQLPIPGMARYGFSADSYQSAETLDAQIERLLTSEGEAAQTLVVVGAGFTGLELATELRSRLKSRSGKAFRIILVDQAHVAGQELGVNPRPYIEEALRLHDIEQRLSLSVEEVREDSVTLTNGEVISSQTVIFATGQEASSLTAAFDVMADPTNDIIPSEPEARDSSAGDAGGEQEVALKSPVNHLDHPEAYNLRETDGRLAVNQDLSIPGFLNSFAAGDVAWAYTEPEVSPTVSSFPDSRSNERGGVSEQSEQDGRLEPVGKASQAPVLEINRSDESALAMGTALGQESDLSTVRSDAERVVGGTNSSDHIPFSTAQGINKPGSQKVYNPSRPRTLFSCQHAIQLGRFAGYNAVRALLGKSTKDYSQVFYATCLDLGDWGALFTTGWDRDAQKIGGEGKAMKEEINTKWIYPPSADLSLAEIHAFVAFEDAETAEA